MITETITYTDLDDVEHTDTLNFHISEAIMLENLDIVDQLQEMLRLSGGPERTLMTEENQRMLDLVKRFLMLSYGVRTLDGGFDQDEPVGSGPVWKRFKISSAYNAFVMSLFRPDPARAAVFMYRVLPTSLRGEDGDLNVEVLPKNLRDIVERDLAKDKKDARLPRGTRIVDDVPVAPLRSVPQTSTDDKPDYDAMMAEAETPVVPKTPINQHQHDLMKSKLRPEQFEDFMSTRYVENAES